ncbi:Ham1-like protein [Hysterangium stoloniferum]|nr:Ham1-like protein [Hysterangium stoloniferum]
MTTKPIIFVTGNANKLTEVRAILSLGTPIDIEARSFDLPEIQGTTQEIAIEKCRRAAELVGGPCITEDTALCFKSLGNLPGPYIKWFIKELGNEGLLRMLEGFSNKDATALCTFAYSPGPGFEPILFEGRTEGRIVSPRGPPNYFGWNPIFEVHGTGLTYAEMLPELKNTISHRFRALDKLKGYLQNNPPSEQ